MRRFSRGSGLRCFATCTCARHRSPFLSRHGQPRTCYLCVIAHRTAHDGGGRWPARGAGFPRMPLHWKTHAAGNAWACSIERVRGRARWEGLPRTGRQWRGGPWPTRSPFLGAREKAAAVVAASVITVLGLAGPRRAPWESGRLPRVGLVSVTRRRLCRARPRSLRRHHVRCCSVSTRHGCRGPHRRVPKPNLMH